MAMFVASITRRKWCLFLSATMLSMNGIDGTLLAISNAKNIIRRSNWNYLKHCLLLCYVVEEILFTLSIIYMTLLIVLLMLPLMFIAHPHHFLNLKQLCSLMTANSRALRRGCCILSSHMTRVNHSVKYEVPTNNSKHQIFICTYFMASVDLDRSTSSADDVLS